MKNLAIIPARGGSKRIPRKNIKPFNGKPIITYSIEAAFRTGLFDEVMISTDDAEIAKIASRQGAVIPFLRSPEMADDYETLADVLIEVVRGYEKRGLSFDNTCCILPTAPLITGEDILSAYQAFSSSDFDSLCPVVPFSYPIFRSLSLSDTGELKMNWPEYLSARSQDLPPAYHDSGTFYWIRSQTLLAEKTLFAAKGTAIVLDEMRVQDIDTETDWKLAELKYQLLYHS